MSKTQQLERFEKRWAKSKKYEELSRKNDEVITEEFSGQEQLAGIGNIKEAAAVFSYQGINLFINMFEGAMNDAVNKALTTKLESLLTNVVGNVVRKELQQVIEGATQGIQKFMGEMSEASATLHIESILRDTTEKIAYSEDVPSTIEEHLANVKGISVEQLKSVVQEPIEHKSVIPPYIKEDNENRPTNLPEGVYLMSQSKESIEYYAPLAFELIRKKTAPFKMIDIMEDMIQLYNVGWSHGSLIIKYLVNKGKNIEKIGFGVYRYTPVQGEEIESLN